MSRPTRWWRPSTSRRPPLRARQRQMYTGRELDATFDTGYECGQGDERKRHEQLEGGLRRLMDAIRESENGDPRPLDDLAREAGVTRDDGPSLRGGTVGQSPTVADDGEHLVDEVERWLRDQGC